MSRVTTTKLTLGKVPGSSPSDDLYYCLVMFDIANQKKYRRLLKLLQRYGQRIQKSVFEGQISDFQYRNLVNGVEKIMSSSRYYHPDDNVRIYRIAGNCSATVFGKCSSRVYEENIFI